VSYDDVMATEPDYYIVTFDTDRGPYPWSWELRRRSSSMGVRIGSSGYQSQTAAEYAGKVALARFLDQLAKEERRDR
jgi:hypothetical protein